MGLGADWLLVAFVCTEEIEARENLACGDVLRGWPSGGRAVPPLPFEKKEAIDLPFASQDGIKPMWEDPRNKRGGRWLVSLSKQQRHIELDRLWLETVSRGLGGEGPHRKGQGWCGPWWQCFQGWQVQSLCHSWRSHHPPSWPQLLCLIGESFEEYSRDVCGAVINIRTKGDKISVWTREAENQTGVLHIG